MTKFGFDFDQVIGFSTVCLVIILIRSIYRLVASCNVHANCCRTRHSDDGWMAFAMLPLILRAIFLDLNFYYSQKGTDEDTVLSRKLLIPGRLFYGLFLWSIKFSLLAFYRRFASGKPLYERLAKYLWYFLILTFLSILPATVLECRPLHIFWDAHPTSNYHCRRGLGNLVTMASWNIVTDILLMLFPVPLVWDAPLALGKKLFVLGLFGLGVFTVAVTIVRLPLIIRSEVTQSSRSLWASVEIFTATVVTNAPFYYTLVRDWVRGTHRNMSGSLEVGTASIRPVRVSSSWEK